MQHKDAKSVLERAKGVHNLRNDTELAEFLGVPRPTLSAWKQRDSIPLRHLAKMATTEVSIDYLLSGEGDLDNNHKIWTVGDDEGLNADLAVIALFGAFKSISRWQEYEENEVDKNDPIYVVCTDEEKKNTLARRFRRSFINMMVSKERWEKNGFNNKEDLLSALAIENFVDDTFRAKKGWWPSARPPDSDPD